MNLFFFMNGYKEIPRLEMKPTFLVPCYIWYLAYLIKGDILKKHMLPNWIPEF